jgi:2-dehydropantoate 2-reductase
MHIYIIGAGAIGIFLSAQFTPHVRVTLLDRHASEFATEDIEVAGLLARRAEVEIGPIGVSHITDADLIMVTTKATYLETVIETLKDCKAPIVFWQNGIGVNQLIRECLVGMPLIRALIWAGVNRETPRLVKCNGFTRIALGTVQGEADPLPLAAVLTKAGLKTEIAGDVDYAEWQKSLWNIGVGGLCTIVGERNGSAVESPHLLRLLVEIIREAQAVARAIGYEFDAEESIIRLTHNTAANLNSMLTDVQNGRQTEIEYLNGHVMRLGAQHGIGTPYNAFVYQMVKHIEAKGLTHTPP